MILDRLIPNTLKNNPKVFQSFRLIILIDLILLCCALVFTPIYWWMEFYAGAYIMGYTAINAVFFLFLMYYTQNFTLGGNFFCIQSWLVFTGLIAFSGGTGSPYFLWLLSIPPIALFYMRSKNAYFWIGVTLFSAIAISIAEIAGFSFPQQVSSTLRPYVAVFNYLTLLLLFIQVVQSFKVGYQRINRKLSQTNEKLLRSNSDLERFAYVASHDLKSPLRNVIGFISLFNRRFGGNLEEEPREYLEIAQSNALRMQNLIEDILEYSQSSNTEMRKEKVDFGCQLKLICEQLKTDPAYEKAEVVFSEMPCLIADSARIYQLFHNLVENGLKYNLSERPTVRIDYQEEKNDHYFVIQDNGIGIPQAYHERIFKMFERLHNQENFQGTGIGLAICLKNVQEYEGSIQVVSEEGKGSQFQLRFPKSSLEKVEKSTEVRVAPQAAAF